MAVLAGYGTAWPLCSPIGYYFCNELSANTVRDTSGRNNDGTAVDVSLGTDGKEGKCYGFNGTTSFFNIQTYQINFSSSYSISFWVKTNASANQVIFCKGKRSEGGVVIEMRGSGTIAAGHDSTILAQGTRTINDNAWHHVYVIFNQGGATLKIYVDNILDTSAGASKTQASTFIDFWFGKGYSTTTGEPLTFFNGSLDNIFIFNGALTDEERDIFYYSILPPKIDSASFNEGVIYNSALDADDFFTLVFNRPTYRFRVDSSNIDGLFPLYTPFGERAGKSWLSGGGRLGPALWNSDSTRLTVFLSTQGGAPFLTDGDNVYVKFYAFGEPVFLFSNAVGTEFQPEISNRIQPVTNLNVGKKVSLASQYRGRFPATVYFTCTGRCAAAAGQTGRYYSGNAIGTNVLLVAPCR